MGRRAENWRMPLMRRSVPSGRWATTFWITPRSLYQVPYRERCGLRKASIRSSWISMGAAAEAGGLP